MRKLRFGTVPYLNIEPFLPPGGVAGLGGQAYGMGVFRCEKDQAVILEFVVG